ncbi:Ankyrin repeat-containing protein [Planctomycetales bacterium 10988]|nr:Ankyrin repeat-containing protein [Planctomycetales bacterium 10988]
MKPEGMLYVAIIKNDLDKVIEACSKYPFLAEEREGKDKPLLSEAVTKGNPKIIEAMLDHGFYIDPLRLPEKTTPLGYSINYDQDEIIELLLTRGANPNIGRPLIGTLNCNTLEKRFKYVKLLVEHGADVNRLYDLYGDSNNQFTVLDWANDPEIVDYLREKGAKTAAELKAQPSLSIGESIKQEKSLLQEVITFFHNKIGGVESQAITETIPSTFPIAIHTIPPAEDRDYLTLFTTGLSSQAMNTPPGEEDYAYAELFIQLPSDWQLEKTNDIHWSWPLDWLFQIAQYPHENDTWLGGALTIIANDEPPQKLAPKIPFTCLMLFAEKSFVRSDQKQVQLYRVVPLYTEERDLELKEGIPALMRAFDRKNVPFVVDLHRPSVVD